MSELLGEKHVWKRESFGEFLRVAMDHAFGSSKYAVSDEERYILTGRVVGCRCAPSRCVWISIL